MRRILGFTANVPVLPQLGVGFPLSLIPAALVVPLRRTSPRPRFLSRLIFAALLSAGAIWLSAAVNGTNVATAAIGHALVFAVSLIAYRVTVRDNAEAAQLTFWFYLGYLGYALLLLPDARVYNLGIEGFWKFGVGTPLAIIAVYLVIRAGGKPGAVGVTLLLFGSLSFVVGFRALGLACFTALFIIAARAAVGRRHGGRTIVVSLVALVVLAWSLQQALVSGVFGQDVAMRTASQTEDSGPAILGGRSEPPLSLAAIRLSPWIGWGSAQAIDNEALSLGVQYAQALGMGEQSNYMGYWVRRDGFVSLHSIFFGNWVEGGVLAAIFPLALIVLFLAAGFLATGRWAPLVTLVAVKTAWDVLFSPLSSNRGVQLAVVAIVCLLALVEYRREKADKGAAPPLRSRRSPARR
ncbi:hypothetical protein ACEYYH_04485 [Microbacterium trichothecenolyticum]|uniref:hypothetical protein n=1 Tax=Microbacterium trichothecenolyticum TaxID=69370 RepID=UPI0035BE38AA